MIREKPPQTPHLRRIFVFEHELPRIDHEFSEIKDDAQTISGKG